MITRTIIISLIRNKYLVISDYYHVIITYHLVITIHKSFFLNLTLLGFRTLLNITRFRLDLKRYLN